MFSLYFDYLLVISRFGFYGLIWVLIASLSGLCILFTYMYIDLWTTTLAYVGLVPFSDYFYFD